MKARRNLLLPLVILLLFIINLTFASSLVSNASSTNSFVYFVNSQNYYSKEFNCTEKYPCRLDGFANDLKVKQKISQVNETQSFVMEFVLMTSDSNFCDYHLNISYNSLMSYELHFVKYSVIDEINLSCSKSLTSEINFIEDRSDIKYMTFNNLILDQIIMKTCSSMSISFIQSQISNVGFFIQSFKGINNCGQIRQAPEGKFLLKNSQFFNSNMFFKFKYEISLENITIYGNSLFSFGESSSMNVINVQFDSSVLITDNVWFMSINNCKIIGTAKIFMRSFGAIYMKSCSFSGNSESYSSLVIENGKSVLLSEIEASYGSGWASFKYIDYVSLEYVTVSRIQISDGSSLTSSPLYFTNCYQILISNSIFDNNSGSFGNILIQEYISIEILNNTFTNCKAKNYGGGALYIENYQRTFIVSGSSITISDNLFENNWSQSFGGAISISVAEKLTVRNNQFKRNVAQRGGGALALMKLAQEGEIVESYFEENRVIESRSELLNLIADSWVGLGGACFINNQPGNKFTIFNSTFVRNVAFKGGAIAGGFESVSSNSTLVRQCQFIENVAWKTGQAVYLIRPQSASVVDQKESGDQTFSSTPILFEIVNVYPKRVYPGQSITIDVKLENVFGKKEMVTSQNIMFGT